MLLLAPWLVVTSGGAAEAAVVKTPEVGVSWDIAGVSYGFGDLECSASVSGDYIDGISSHIWFDNLNCYVLLDTSPGYAQPGEEGSTFKLWVTGTDCGGSTTGTFLRGAEDGFKVVHGVGPEFIGYASGPSTCDPATACITVSGGGSTFSKCSAIALDPPGAPPAAGCLRADSVSRPAVVGAPFYPDPRNGYAQYHVPVSFPIVPATAQENWLWVVYAYVQYNSGGAPVLQTLQEDRSGLFLSTGGTINVPVGTRDPSVTGAAEGGPVDRKVIGYGLFAEPLASWNTTTRTEDSLPQQNANGLIGVTDTARCAYYWGPKVAETTTNDYDEPIGPAGGDQTYQTPTPPAETLNPDEAEEGCVGFSWTDPASWASSGMCMVAGLLGRVLEVLGSILSAIGDLIGGIVNGILDGLTSLLIPDDWPDWSDVPSPLPNGWLPSMPDIGPASCGSLTFPRLELGFQGWGVGPVDYADTCAAPWPTVRLFTYNGMLLLVLVSAVWMGFRVIASGLGMGVTMGSGSGDDD